MPVPRALSRHLALVLAGAAGLPACRTGGGGAVGPATDAQVAAAAEARLRALFPEVQGPLTRESIELSLARAPAGPDPIAVVDPVRARAVEALRRGDDEPALQLLSELAAAREAQAARALRTAGDVDGALAGYARALDIAPHSTALRRERGETALEDGLARGDRARIEAARADFLEATRRARGEDRDAARAWLGASRASRALGDTERALEAARRAFATARDPRELEGAAEPAERTLAEALVAALDAAGSERERAELGAEARSVLAALVARTPDEPWAWAHYCRVLQSEPAPEATRAAALTGLRVFPRDAALADALAGSARALGGREAVVATFDSLSRKDPTDAGAVWRPAEERYQRGIEALLAGTADEGTEASFREAGKGFLRAGSIAPDRASAANAAIARCLAGVALALRARDDLVAARHALVEADERDPRALTEPLAPGLASGVETLRAIAALQRARGDDPTRADATECLAEAATAYMALQRIAPGDADEAVLTARLASNAALAFEARARVAAERSRRDAAQADLARARELMEAALVAATEAARRKPDDVDAVRAPGRLLVRFLQRDPMQAQTWLQKAVDLSLAEVARAREAAEAPGLDAAQREVRARRVEEAESRLGDLYQDLGVLSFDLKGDAVGAKSWFEKALRTGPDPREDLRAPGGWIARCEAAIASGTNPKLAPEERWGVLP